MGTLISKPEFVEAPFVLDDRASTTAERGAFVPYLLGYRRVAPNILWVGDRTGVQEEDSSTSPGGGKGSRKKSSSSSSNKRTVYRESAWHGLAVGSGGPAQNNGECRLHRIWRAGKIVWDQTVGQGVNPSGSSFQTSEGNTFSIFWGERTQPVNTFLQDANRIGIASRWPNLLYVVWEQAKLGPSPVWPVFEYEIEVPLLKPQKGNIICNSHGNFDYGAIQYPEADPALNGGVNEWNGAHTLDQLLFAQWPQGLELDPYMFDQYSFEHLGVVIDAEPIFTSLIGDQGRTAKELIEDLMADLGFVIPWEVNWNATFAQDYSRFVLRPLRDPNTGPPPPTLPSEYVADLLAPEIDLSMRPVKVSQVNWQFADKAHEFANQTVSQYADDRSDFIKSPKVTTKSLPTVTTLFVASKVSERRAQEALGTEIKHKIKALRQARYLTPGRTFFMAGVTDLLLVESVEITQGSRKVTINAVSDFYGRKASGFLPSSGGSTPQTPPPPLADLARLFIEVPAEIAQGQVSVSELRIRANADQLFAFMHVSTDNLNYQFIDTDKGVTAGGNLLAAIDVTDPYELAVGPEINVIGPDIGSVADLTGQTAQWRLGTQIAVIGQEIFFLQKIVPTGPNTMRLEGLIRARYNTERATHGIGETVFIFRDTELKRLFDPLIAPLQDLYIKGQPVASTALALGSVVPVSKLPVYGLGLVPEPPRNLRVRAPQINVPAYQTGQDIELAWGFFTQAPGSSFSGAGLINAGTPAPIGPLIGEFFLQIENEAGTVIGRTVVLTVAAYTYTNANLVADFGSEINVRFRLVHRNGGFVSDPSTTLLVSFV